MKKRFLYVSLALLLAISLVGCSDNQASNQDIKENIKLNISAAASLQDAAQELQTLYQKDNPKVELIYNFGASGTLQQQIEEGAPCDLFISAGQKQMNALEEQVLLLDGSRSNLLKNELVLIAGLDSDIASMEDLATDKVEKISIGTPESVPAGNYAKEALTNLNLWSAVKSKIVYAKDVRQVLTYVETGNVDAGLVYLSDTIVSDQVKVILSVPSDAYTEVTYPMAILNSSTNSDEAKAFVEFLKTEEAGNILKEYGFKPL